MFRLAEDHRVAAKSSASWNFQGATRRHTLLLPVFLMKSEQSGSRWSLLTSTSAIRNSSTDSNCLTRSRCGQKAQGDGAEWPAGERRQCKGGKYHVRQRSHRVALRRPAGRNSCDGCGSPSSVGGLGRLCDLRGFVGWFCDMVQNPPMISRDAGSAMKRPRRKHESMTHHEAGHAVAALCSG